MATTGPTATTRRRTERVVSPTLPVNSVADIVDDPHRRRGLRSKPFDGEGVANAKHLLVEDGVLKTWVLDLRSARQLGLKTTGHAARGTSSLKTASVKRRMKGQPRRRRPGMRGRSMLSAPTLT